VASEISVGVRSRSAPTETSLHIDFQSHFKKLTKFQAGSRVGVASQKLIKIGAKVISHGRYVTFQLAEVAVSRQMFAEILSLITRLRAPPAPA
jgi:hypothetical protein